MKKVGEILREERLRQSKSIEEISQLTNIQTSFLEAIEKGEYVELPNPVYIRGFITNYANALNLPREKIIPFYRREFEPDGQPNVKRIPIPIDINKFKITPGKLFVFLASIALTAFLVLLFWQYRNFAGIPVLVVDYPPEDYSTTQEVIEIQGRTDPQSTVTVNGEQVEIDVTGYFTIPYHLNEGLNRVKIIAESDLGKQHIIEQIVEKNQE